MFYVVNFLLKRIDICVTIRITKLRRTLLMLEIDSYHSELNEILRGCKKTALKGTTVHQKGRTVIPFSKNTDSQINNFLFACNK